MTKYTVTTDDGSGPLTPEDRASFENEKAATDDAQNALADMARDALPDGSHARFEASVEDETGEQVYRASLEFNAQGRDEIAGDEAETERAVAKLVRTLRMTTGSGTVPRRLRTCQGKSSGKLRDPAPPWPVGASVVDNAAAEFAATRQQGKNAINVELNSAVSAASQIVALLMAAPGPIETLAPRIPKSTSLLRCIRSG